MDTVSKNVFKNVPKLEKDETIFILSFNCFDNLHNTLSTVDIVSLIVFTVLFFIIAPIDIISVKTLRIVLMLVKVATGFIVSFNCFPALCIIPLINEIISDKVIIALLPVVATSVIVSANAFVIKAIKGKSVEKTGLALGVSILPLEVLSIQLLFNLQ